LAVVQRWRSGQPRHSDPKMALPLLVMRTVLPAGQVAVARAVSMVKSSTVNPPGTAARDEESRDGLFGPTEHGVQVQRPAARRDCGRG